MRTKEVGQHMDQRDLLLVIVRLCADRKEFGRTSLQKVAYFCGLALERDLGHDAHYYGPYSETVEREIDLLIYSELLEERTTRLGFASARGYEAKRYEYSLTPDGLARVELLRQAYADDVERVRKIVDKLVDVCGGLDQRILSPAAKTLFLVRDQQRALRDDEISANAKRLGWQLDPDDVRRVVGVLVELGFARRE